MRQKLPYQPDPTVEQRIADLQAKRREFVAHLQAVASETGNRVQARRLAVAFAGRAMSGDPRLILGAIVSRMSYN